MITVLFRRKWSLLLPVATATALAAICALLLPRAYVSTATILAEGALVPPEQGSGGLSGFAERRVRTIGHRVLSHERLAGVIERLELYPELKGAKTIGEIVARMRDDLQFSRVEADLAPAREGWPASAAIFFDIGYKGENPETVWRVAQEFASLFAEEDVRFREARWAESQAILEGEMRAAREDIAAHDLRIAEYRVLNAASLPERLGENRQELQQLERKVELLRQRLDTLHERESGMTLRLKTVLLDDPERTILSLQLEETWADKEEALKALRVQERRRGAVFRRIEATPAVEKGLVELEAGRAALQARCDTLAKKAEGARAVFEAERRLRGERIIVVRQPRFPTRPSHSLATMVLLAGLLPGLAVGVAWVAWKEVSDKTAHSLEQVVTALPFPALVAIPEIATPDRDMRRGRRSGGAA